MTDGPLTDFELYYTKNGLVQVSNDVRRRILHELTDKNLSLTALYSLQKAEKEALSKHVWLKSGASLVIEPTETLTVIDVNTGKAITGKKAGDETFYKINEEAAKECMRQLRLRNLSGMILIDFINMEDTSYNEKLMQLLKELAARDRIPVNVVDMTGLKLVELTRKKVRKPLHEMVGFNK